jgi:hypothetical protein
MGSTHFYHSTLNFWSYFEQSCCGWASRATDDCRVPVIGVGEIGKIGGLLACGNFSIIDHDKPAVEFCFAPVG